MKESETIKNALQISHKAKECVADFSLRDKLVRGQSMPLRSE